MDIALIALRTVHFLATVQLGGLVVFCAIVMRSQLSADVGRQLSTLFWLSFVALLISGAGWGLAVARAIDGTTSFIAFQDGTALSVLTDTQFGNAWLVRLVAALALAISALLRRSLLQRIGKLISATILVGGLAFAGHGASSPGVTGDVHLTADIIHLVAVTCWVGGLLPYALILHSSMRGRAGINIEAGRNITQRYSNLATISVLMILVTGIINSLYLVRTPTALLTSDYGRLLSLKILVFITMLIFAAINRFVLMAHFSPKNISALNRNALIEFALGAVALILVAAFGTMPPPL